MLVYMCSQMPVYTHIYICVSANSHACMAVGAPHAVGILLTHLGEEGGSKMGLAIVVHGGAGAMAPDRHEAAAQGCREAVIAGWRTLQGGGSALDAVQAAIVMLENNPGFNAGTGAVLTTDGRAQLDAGIMDGEELQVGAVAGVERVRNPIVLARRVLESPHVLLMGAGAEQFALESSMPLCDPSALITATQYARWQRGYRPGDAVNVGPIVVASQEERASAEVKTPSGKNGKNGKGHTGHNGRNGAKPRAKADGEPIHADGHKHGTVGAVLVDPNGTLPPGASTARIPPKHPGRIRDTPLVGCGYCAENGRGGVSSTGHGEDFMLLLLARRALDYIAGGMSPQAAATAAVRMLDQRIHGDGGLILLDAHGRVGYARTTLAMAHAFLIEGMTTPFAGV